MSVEALIDDIRYITGLVILLLLAISTRQNMPELSLHCNDLPTIQLAGTIIRRGDPTAS